MVAHPGGRHHHGTPTPLIGAVVVAGAVGVALAAGSDRPVLLAGAGAIAVCLLGALDDLRPIGALTKLAGQAVIAVTVVAAGLGGEVLTLPLIGSTELGHLRVATLALFLVLAMNAINLLDGMDGLAGGVVAVSAVTLAILAAGTGHPDAAALAACTAAASLAFLRQNLRGRVFLGDQGSLGLGFLLGACALAGSAKTGATISLLPAVVLALPLLDASAVAVARLRRGQRPWVADRRHLHHRLLASGMPVATVRRRLWALSGLCGLYALLVAALSETAPLADGLRTAILVGLGIVVLAALVAAIAGPSRRMRLVRA